MQLVSHSIVNRETKGRGGRYEQNELLVKSDSPGQLQISALRPYKDPLAAQLVRGQRINHKAVHCILGLMGWSMKKRPNGLRPRVAGWKSATDKPDQRWAIDTSHIMTQRDGLCHITAIIDCCDRKIVGWRMSKSGKADVAAAAWEDAFIRRSPQPGLKLSSDNGLVFVSKKFHAVVRRHTCLQEIITPYTPEQNGMIERWFRTLKSECLWLQQLKGVKDTRESIDSFIETYHEDRPHRSLGMLTPSEWADRFAA